ncbi:hypothetical protein GF420_13110 [candidate division GN15 bacterium]|nr:hypothetical protein [candidate division GN15 bacterium]
MAGWNDGYDSHWSGEPGTGFPCDVDKEWPDGTDPAEIFVGLTSRLQSAYPIRKALLILKEGDHNRFCAVATFNDGAVRKNLSLRLPMQSSLFEKVAEDRHIYTENYYSLFSGNTFERNLLLDDWCQSFAVIPLVTDGLVIGILGFSSDQPNAFVTFEEGVLDRVIDRLANRLSRELPRTE